MAGKYLYTARMDVAHDKDKIFNEVYDKEHIPAFMKVPGMLRATRFRTSNVAEPRYLGLYELERPEVQGSPEWNVAREMGRWPKEVRPHTMNRRHATYSWVGGSKELKHTTKYLLYAMMDVEPHKEALFNEIYESEHLPLIGKAPGVVNIVRYITTADGHPKYLAVYEIERPEAFRSPEWNKGSDAGRWNAQVRDYTYNKHLVVYERI